MCLVIKITWFDAIKELLTSIAYCAKDQLLWINIIQYGLILDPESQVINGLKLPLAILTCYLRLVHEFLKGEAVQAIGTEELADFHEVKRLEAEDEESGLIEVGDDEFISLWHLSVEDLMQGKGLVVVKDFL